MADTDLPDGERNTEGAEADSRMPKRILALDNAVVNKIAAGEIIISPVNALKELLENSIDAKATQIEVVVKDGGLKLLQITDNGSGIQRDDLEILCVRHTTSKLAQFDELLSIASYGFRGEALASISHIAHLSVTTRTHDSDVAWRAHYLDGALVPAKPGGLAEPKITAGRPGTQFTIEDMFFNIPIRRKAFRSPGEEYNKIIDMVGRYAIHCDSVGFSCKKQGDASTSLAVQAAAGPIDRIRLIYGSAVANELIGFDVASDKWGFQATGWVTNANYSIKKTTFLLFVNHRLVESQPIKKTFEQMYAAFLPKHGRPFVYLSLAVRPDHVDVNLHPTKRVVGLVHEDEITQVICEHVREKLAEVDHSRAFATRQPVQVASADGDNGGGGEDGVRNAGNNRGATEPLSAAPAESKRPRRNSNSLVRTDAASQKITSMFLPSASVPPLTTTTATTTQVAAAATADGDDTVTDELVRSAPESVEYEHNPRAAVPVALKSILELRQEVRDSVHEEMTRMMEHHIFVGIVDERRRLAAIQSGTKLYLVDYGRVAFEYVTQVLLNDFGNFGVINFKPPLDVGELLAPALDAFLTTPAGRGADRAALAAATITALTTQREMLEEYFALEMTPTGELKSLPLLIRGYTPPMVKLPALLLNLGRSVDWTREKPCLRGVIAELAAFYVPEQLPCLPGSADALRREDLPEAMKARRRNVRWAVEHVFFPAFKQRLVLGKECAREGVWEMASLKDMYKTFERC